MQSSDKQDEQCKAVRRFNLILGKKVFALVNIHSFIHYF